MAIHNFIRRSKLRDIAFDSYDKYTDYVPNEEEGSSSQQARHENDVVCDDNEMEIKKMRSNKSKEFFAELKVLCKIHHINVVELLGYASGDDHLYLVYEYIQNGSVSDHLHDPLLKAFQLSLILY
ncbi:lysM domain receptor-like kinase 3 [Camellia sinensis]|uniref:lysM domain receptor-like kinase 3 n=1 Tax=Camellia sinensis TaxID=4442 RepID=UPI001035EB95|nr:lysM domain receptor-like kinase 3 [Camellia sinensis]